MAEKFAAITALTDAFSKNHLNDEYLQLIRRAVGALAACRGDSCICRADRGRRLPRDGAIRLRQRPWRGWILDTRSRLAARTAVCQRPLRHRWRTLGVD